jgi:hypothetical protein
MSVQRNLHKPLHSHFFHARCAYSSSNLPSDKENQNASYQPGGTFMATTGRWTTRSKGKALADPSGLGCWSGLTYIGKQNKRLTVLTAYRSPRQQPSAGYGFYDQQNALLLSQGVRKPNVRRQFITDLIQFINNLQSEGHEILLLLDANEILGQEKTFGIGHLLDECTLRDIGVLTKCNDSEWAAPTFIQPKKTGDVRVLTDFRVLNRYLKRKPYPIPKIADLLQKLEGFTWATALDLSMGYYHIVLDTASSYLCTMIVPWGKYCYCCLLMGLSGSPDIFQAIMNSESCPNLSISV